MNFGSPEFVLAIIAVVTFAGVLKSAVRAKHGLGDEKVVIQPPLGLHGSGKDAEALAALRLENRQLREKLELHENRLISLERIVTDPGYDVARQIEALRHESTPLPAFPATRDRTSA